VQNNSPEFWNRESELEALRSWRVRGARLAVIHGRRRLGKTALLRRWLARESGWYVVTRKKIEEVVRTMERRPEPPHPEGATVHRGLFVPSRKGLPPEVRGVALLDADAVVRGEPAQQ
jgi:hypothetical protein